MKFFGITIAYWVTLFFLEALGYYVLGIRLATSYPSFLGSGVLHLPLYGQLFYLTIGPIYLLVTNYLEETNQLINKMFYEKSNL